MRFDASQQMRLGQHMKLAPRMIQSMEILQMPLTQLEERIAQELESNVTLEIDDEAPAGGVEAPEGAGAAERAGEIDGPMSVDESSGRDDFERLESFESDNPEVAENAYDESLHDRAGKDEYPDFERMAARASPGGDGGSDAKMLAMNNTASRAASLQEQLRDQWRLADVDEDLASLGEQIIGFIDDDGYLREQSATIIDRMPATDARSRPSVEKMERALQAVQLMLDPPGVAARSTRECLLLQVDAILDQRRGATDQTDREGWSVVRRLIADHLDDLAQNRLPRIAEKTQLPMDAIRSAIEKMRLLSLAPARQLVEDPPSVIVPDAIVEYDADADRYVAYLNDSRLPNLRINQEYARLAKDRESPTQTREFVKKNLSNATWLLDAVEQRRRTLLRVINVVVQAQREYFDYGPQALRPLPMTQVAEQLGVHVATVSRAVAEKYLLTPRGVVPLRSFFSGGTQTQSGEEVSWDAVKAALKDVIDAEDKSSPLSDDALAEELSRRGIDIARRTVAKYRDQLSIPSARLRKAH
ncbi:MAG: RNA polymerase factor sigma-54 [Phycisphaerales bacterium]|nr:RNA polymerase factor sigma-54 [Phycisphaerales bacterium]